MNELVIRNNNHATAKLAIVGPVSSGKSTLTNLLIGRFLIPVSLQRSTTTPIRITHNPTLGGEIRVQSENSGRVEQFLDIGEARHYISKLMAQEGQFTNTISVELVWPHYRPKPWRTKWWQYWIKCLLGAPPYRLWPHRKQTIEIIEVPALRLNETEQQFENITNWLDADIFICLFDAAETNTPKEERFWKSVWSNIPADTRGRVVLLPVLNRIDVFRKDRTPTQSLEKRYQEVELILKSGRRDISWFDDTVGELRLISAFPAMLAQVICDGGADEEVSEFLAEKVEAEAVRLLPNEVLRELPRSFVEWNRSELEKFRGKAVTARETKILDDINRAFSTVSA